MAIRALFQSLFANRLARRVAFAVLIILLLLGGIQLRRWTWAETRHVRFQHDIVNAFYWGSETLKEGRRLSRDDASANSWAAFVRGYFTLYDRVQRKAYKNDYRLDYPPLRLLVMSIWARQVRNDFPEVDDGHPKHVKPLLNVNLACELISAVAIFLLVRLWMRRSSAPTHSSFLRGLPLQHRAGICGLAAASVAWFEPSMILDTHGWPQWDVWILPFYLFAVLAASKKRWFLCGCLLAAGAMFKGQLLLVVPFFVLWPLWQKRWTRALRLVAGFASTTALVVSPWLLRTPTALIVVAFVGSVSCLIFLGEKFRHPWAWVAGMIALGTFVAGALAGGSFAWLQIGFLYGSEHYPYLFISSCYNLPFFLDRLGLSLKDSVWSYEFGSQHVAVTVQWMLRLAYLGGLALCSLGAARHWRNRDPRLLIAIATPWLLMFALLGQMHERYLVWGAVVSAVALGVSLRLSVVHFIISAMSTAMIVHVMLVDKKLETTLHVVDMLHGVRPYASGLLLACAAVCLWDTVSTRVPGFQRRRRQSRAEEMPALSLGPAPEEAKLN
jgi:Glycosyltransferase family 87